MADDIAQDAFERAFAALSRFDRARPFAPWLHRIVVNRSLDLLRSERRLVGLDSVAEMTAPDLRASAAGDRALLETVATLSPQRRVVVVLRYGLGYSPQEIAGILDLPAGTVHSRLARALEDLRQPKPEGSMPSELESQLERALATLPPSSDASRNRLAELHLTHSTRGRRGIGGSLSKRLWPWLRLCV